VANPENLIGKGFDVDPTNANRNGRPKGALNRSTLYRKHLEKSGKKGLVVDDVILAAIDKALTGDIVALKELMDSGYGKVPDKLESKQDHHVSNVTQKVLSKLSDEDIASILATDSLDE